MKNFKVSQTIYNKRIFNPKDKKDLEEFGYFVRHNCWKNNCPFHLEWPYDTIPTMIKDKIIESMFK
jgi:hypothetical protein